MVKDKKKDICKDEVQGNSQGTEGTTGRDGEKTTEVATQLSGDPALTRPGTVAGSRSPEARGTVGSASPAPGGGAVGSASPEGDVGKAWNDIYGAGRTDGKKPGTGGYMTVDGKVADDPGADAGGNDGSVVYPRYPKINGLDELIGRMEQARDANRVLTKKDIERLRRQQRTEGIISGIGDASRALANLYFTSKYAPDMYDATKGMSAATKARWEKALAERQAENDRYYQWALKINQLRERQAANEYKAEKAAADAARDQGNKDRTYQWNVDKYNSDLEYKKNKDKDNLEQRKKELEERDKYHTAMANRPTGRGGGGGGRKTGGSGSYDNEYYKQDGSKGYAKTGGEAKRRSQDEGTWEPEQTTTKSNGITKTTTKTGGYSKNPKAGNNGNSGNSGQGKKRKTAGLK